MEGKVARANVKTNRIYNLMLVCRIIIRWQVIRHNTVDSDHYPVIKT